MNQSLTLGTVIQEIGIFIAVPILAVIAWNVWLSYIQTLFLRSIKWVMIEVKPPKEVFKSPLAMELVLNSLYAGAQGGDWYTKYWKGELSLYSSLEIVSKEGTVHFYIRLPEKFKKTVEAQIYAQYPQAEVLEVSDYTTEFPEFKKGGDFNLWGCNFVLSKDDVYPIKSYIDYGLDKAIGSLDEEQRIDPITPLLEYIGSLQLHEHVWIQILIRPDTKRFTVKKKGVEESGKDWKAKAAETITELKANLYEKDENGKPVITLTTKTQTNTLETIERHADKFGFDSFIRAVYIAKGPAFNAATRAPALIGAFRQFNSSQLNGFKPDGVTKVDFPWQDLFGNKIAGMKADILGGYNARAFFYGGFDPFSISSYFTHPNQSGGKPYILSTEELATLFHLPGRVAETPSFTRIEATKAEPPANLPI